MDVVADVVHLPFISECFDRVYLRHVLEHVNDLAALQEAKRVLKSGGSIHVEVPNAYYLPIILRYSLKSRYSVSREHIHAYGEVELSNLLEASGFQKVRIGYSSYAPRHQPKPSILENFIPVHLRGQISAEANKP
ncbi:MAG: methyltransferase domain-containing protein [Nitrososphaerales archaeon]